MMIVTYYHQEIAVPRVAMGVDQFNLRLPEALRRSIREIAADNRRSMNSEIVVILENAVAQTAETKKGEVTA